MNRFKNWKNMVADALHVPTSIILISIGVFFVILIFKVFFGIVIEFFTNGIALSVILEEIFLVLLFVELVAAIKIYFRQNYHFPLRFFLYIGITDVIRRMIIVIEDANLILIYSLGLLVLVGALALLEIKNTYLRRKSKEIGEEHFEL